MCVWSSVAARRLCFTNRIIAARRPSASKHRSAGARKDRKVDRSKVDDNDDDDDDDDGDDDDDVMMMMQARALQSDGIAILSMLGSIAARARSRRAGALNLTRNGRLKGTLN